MENQGVGSWIYRRRHKSGNDTALIFNGTSTSYGEFQGRIDRLANALRERGIEKGSRVAYLGENHTAFLDLFFAAATLGAIFVPINARLAAPEIGFALHDSGVTILVHPESVEHIAAAALSGTAVTHRLIVDDSGFASISTTPVKTVSGAVSESGGIDSRGRASQVTVERFDDVVELAEQGHIDVAVGHDDPAIILYTSGTTGNPKGALLTHGNLIWNSINVIVDYDIVSTEIALMISPLFHVASLGMGLLPVFLKGGTIVLEPKFDPARVLQLVQEHKITSLSGVPTTFQLLCEHPAWDSTDISSLNKLTCGGSAVPLRVIEAYEKRELSFSSGYGMTETAPGATSVPPAHSREKVGSSGLPHFFTDVRTVDEVGAEVAAGEVGEIQIKGPNVIREYWNRPDATAESFAEDVWFRSGDMGSFDDDGYLFISDRLKDMIISGGENIYPAQVEQIVRELDEVFDVALIGIADERWGEVPWAIVELREGRALSEAEVLEHLNGRVARYKVPKKVIFVSEFPRTASGKVRKAELRKIYSA